MFNEKIDRLNLVINAMLVLATLGLAGVFYYAYEVNSGPSMNEDSFNIFIFATFIFIIVYALTKHDLIRLNKKFHIEIPKIIIKNMYVLISFTAVVLVIEFLMFVALIRHSVEFQENVVTADVLLLIVNLVYTFAISDSKKKLIKSKYIPFAQPENNEHEVSDKSE